jgi:hypothetical protein
VLGAIWEIAVIQAQQAATITQAWVNLEQQFGAHATAFMRKFAEPAIQEAARDGRNVATIDGVSPMFISQLQLALASLGYKTQLDASRLVISW